jgi:hypothetical protein
VGSLTRRRQLFPGHLRAVRRGRPNHTKASIAQLPELIDKPGATLKPKTDIARLRSSTRCERLKAGPRGSERERREPVIQRDPLSFCESIEVRLLAADPEPVTGQAHSPERRYRFVGGGLVVDVNHPDRQRGRRARDLS